MRNLYKIWRNIINKCTNPNLPCYTGQKMCLRWRESYQSFKEDLGMPPVGAKLRLIDPALGYNPKNCVWGYEKYNTPLEFGGRTLTLKQWAELLDIAPQTLLSRLELKWTVQKALCTPVKRKDAQENIYVLRMDGMADEIKFENKLSELFADLEETLTIYCTLKERAQENKYPCDIELLKRAPSDPDWVVVLSYSGK